MREHRLAEDYFGYNPDADPNGSQGIEIAEQVFKRCRYDFQKLHKWVDIHRKKERIIGEIQ